MQFLNRIIVAACCGLFTFSHLLAQDKLPDVSLANLDGEKVNVVTVGSEGKITLFDFWATWCGPCKKGLNNMAELYDEWKEKYNFQIIAVSTDDARSVAKVKPYVEAQRWDYEVLLDTNEELKRSLNFQAVPYSILVNQKGEIVYRHDGYKEGDEYELEKMLAELAANPDAKVKSHKAHEEEAKPVEEK
jgi:cytochrome c biogenesis protein CcmG/thiol:disulfide interchange protein DsbE